MDGKHTQKMEIIVTLKEEERLSGVHVKAFLKHWCIP